MAEFLAERNSAFAAWNTAVLQGLCMFVFGLDYSYHKSNHAKFQLNPLRNG